MGDSAEPGGLTRWDLVVRVFAIVGFVGLVANLYDRYVDRSKGPRVMAQVTTHDYRELPSLATTMREAGPPSDESRSYMPTPNTMFFVVIRNDGDRAAKDVVVTVPEGTLEVAVSRPSGMTKERFASIGINEWPERRVAIGEVHVGELVTLAGWNTLEDTPEFSSTRFASIEVVHAEGKAERQRFRRVSQGWAAFVRIYDALLFAFGMILLSGWLLTSTNKGMARREHERLVTERDRLKAELNATRTKQEEQRLALLGRDRS